MGLETTTVSLGKNKPVLCIRSTSSSDRQGKRKPTVIFEHSWNIPPLPDYREFLTVLDERVTVHALVKNGVHLFSQPPRDLAGYGEITCDYIRQLPEQERGEVHLIGHSMGFITGYDAARRLGASARSLIGLSPLLPGNHTLTRFIGRLGVMTLGMLAGTTGASGRRYVLQSAVNYSGRAVRNLAASVELVRQMAGVAFASEPLEIPTCLIRGSTDELIPWGASTSAAVERAFSNVTQRLLSGGQERHSFPIIFGSRAAAEVLALYEQWRVL